MSMWNIDDFRNFQAIYIGKNIDMSTPIMRYTSLRTLEQIMQNQLYVSKRKCYDDPHERGNYTNRSMSYPFEFMSRKTKEERIAHEKENVIFYENIEKSYDTLTSCWTYSQKEKLEMWEMDGNREILIKTTIGQLLSAIDTRDFHTIVCDKMLYCQKEGPKGSLHDFLFLKEGNFDVEEELRFYFFTDRHNEVNYYQLPLYHNLFFNTIIVRLMNKDKISNVEKMYPILTNFIKTSVL